MSQSALIILAGGSGSRFQSQKPKQMALLAGKTILQHTLENVSGCEAVKQIVVVCRKSILAEVDKIVSNINHPSISVVEGGESRLESTLAGLQAVRGNNETKVLLHDGVRPFIKHSVIEACYSRLDSCDAVDVVINSNDTLVEIDSVDVNTIKNIPSRKLFRRGQTPQGFWLGDIRKVILEVEDISTAEFTDDCGLYLAHRPEAKIAVVHGDDSNIKITHPIDLFIAEQLIMGGNVSTEVLEEEVDVSSMNIVIFGDTSGLGENARTYLEGFGATVNGGSRSTGCDITNCADIEAVLAAAACKGPINVIINFAGIMHVGNLVELDPSVVEDIVRINYIGALNVARQSFEYLKASKGQLILISSSSYYHGRKSYAAYSSSKAAVVNLTQALCEEWLPDEIRVNCLVPRRANTPMRQLAFPGEDPSTLLDPRDVSLRVLKLIKSSNSGSIDHVY